MLTVAEFKQILLRDIQISTEHDNLSQSTIDLYIRQLLRLYKHAQKMFEWSQQEFLQAIYEPQKYNDSEFDKVFKNKKSDIIAVLLNLYTSKESQILTLNAMCKMVKNRFRGTFDYFNAIRKVLSKQNKDEKLNNELTPKEMERYISYDELMAIPEKVKTEIMKKHGTVFISHATLSELKKAEKTKYLKLVFDYVTLYLNIHYPLRLVWPTIMLQPLDGANYLEGDKLYLNDFKNVRLMGSQVITLDINTMKLITQYLSFLRNTLGETPTKLLYRMYNNSVGSYDYTPQTSGGFSHILSRTIKKYNGTSLSMNIIRHIVESHVIQSADYAKLTNKEKHDLHSKLLHSSQAANVSYNKIVNRAAKPAEPAPNDDNYYEFNNGSDDAIMTADNTTVRAPTQRSKRRERIFHGEFKPKGAERAMEIDIYQN